MAINLTAESRDKVGSRAARKLRAAGRIPCSLQETGKPVIALSIDEAEFMSARRQHEHLFDIQLDGAAHPAIVRELQWDYLSDSIIHCEFQLVQRGVKVESDVSLEFVGTPKGGVLNVLVDHLKVASIPSKIPDHIEVLVSELDDGAQIAAADIVMPEGVELASPEDLQIAVISGVVIVEDEPTEEVDADSVEIVGQSEAPPEEEA